MAQYKVGGKVVVLEHVVLKANIGGEIFEIKKGDIYTVRDIKACSCGSLSLDIGMNRIITSGHKCTSECVCGKVVDTNVVWFISQHFAPVQEQEFRAVTFEKIINEIPVSAQ